MTTKLITDLTPVLDYLDGRIAAADIEIEKAKTWTDAARGAILRSHLRQARKHLATVDHEFDHRPPAPEPGPLDPLANDYRGGQS